MARPLTASIDLEALRHNYRLACECAPHSQALAVIKANAYGHGALACARALESLAPAFGVASIEEADALRDGGIESPVVLLEGFFDPAELQDIAHRDYWCVVHAQWQLEALLAAELSAPITVWVKLDSGMHRLGFQPADLPVVWQRLAASSHVSGLRLMTHFATAELMDTALFQQQAATAQSTAHQLNADICFANSPATLCRPEVHGGWNRPGIMLYGASPLEGENDLSRRLKPVMTLSSRIIAVQQLEAGEPVGYGGRFVTTRPSRIAVIACGYGDGYDRHAPDGTPVLVDGIRCGLVGRVSMDMMTVDITDVPSADIGTTVTLWGRGPNEACLDINEVARYCDTISYTLLTGVLPRVPRHYP
ncbi:alanine racemase [Larsenimonas rhizosphaerae]|uniref:Alanine racemase n=1 Tax=Larsenimonas rhizosphaerae TaxID=2944682 RepID=A0AA42CY94_9GAMM|nr:alanine racemase [Larsenimonas rhizosphaerae]MCX2524870.1 alanine racemase [Larsenimonas rhizosphaerae]